MEQKYNRKYAGITVSRHLCSRAPQIQLRRERLREWTLVAVICIFTIYFKIAMA